jgi:hypothetical protein
VLEVCVSKHNIDFDLGDDTWRKPWGDALDALKYAVKAVERTPTPAERLEEERDRLKRENEDLRAELREVEEKARRLTIDLVCAKAKAEIGVGTIPKAMWRKLVALCHPDRHPGSEVAPEVTRWLLELRP